MIIECIDYEKKQIQDVKKLPEDKGVADSGGKFRAVVGPVEIACVIGYVCVSEYVYVLVD